MTKKQIPPTGIETKSGVEASTESLWLDTAIQRLKQPDQDTSQSELPRDLTDRYQLMAEVGSGSFGIVYRADDRKLGRKVAIKLLRHQYAQSSEFCKRFEAEAVLAGQIEHLNVARVYDSHVDSEVAYLVMEFVEGKSLAELNRQDAVPEVRVACQLVKAATDGLSAAHQAGLVHRDVKAANILVTEDLDRVCLTDFGLAQDQQNESTGVAGSLAYMSPEHLDPHRRIDERADIYSMGIVLFELLTGTRPFDGTGEALRQQILFATAPSVIQKNRSVPQDIATITEKCLQKDPSERYQTAADLAADLQAWLDGRPIQARPVGPIGRTLRWAMREPMVALLTTLLVFGLITAGALGAMSIQEIVRQRDLATASAAFANTQTDHFLNVVDLTVNRIDQKLRNQPNSQKLRQELLSGVAVELQQISEDLEDAPEFSLRLVVIYTKMGSIFTVIGETEKAEQQYKKAVEVAESIYQQDPKSSEAANAYTSSLLALADCQTTYQFKFDDAQESCDAALRIADDHVDPIAMTQVRVVALRCLSDIAIRRDDLPLAHDYMIRAVEIVESDQATDLLPPEEVTRTLEAFGDLLFRGGAFSDSAEWFRKALVHREGDVESDPQNESAVDALVSCLVSLSRADTNSTKFVAALLRGQRAVDLAEGQVKRFPSDRSRKRSLAVAYDALGTCYSTCGDSVNAKRFYQRALEIHESLSNADEGNQELIWDLASQHVMIADSFMADFRPDKARQEYEIAKELLSQIDVSKDSAKEQNTIDQQLQTCEFVELVTAEDLVGEMLQGADSLVVGSRLLQLVRNGKYQAADELSRAIHPLEPKLCPIDLFNVACIYGSSHHHLATLEESTKSEDLKQLAGHLKHETLRVLSGLHQKKQLDEQVLGPSLYRSPYLRSLHDEPQMKKILSEISDPLLDIESSVLGPEMKTNTL